LRFRSFSKAENRKESSSSRKAKIEKILEALLSSAKKRALHRGTSCGAAQEFHIGILGEMCRA
jgi:hypothetical protein